MPSSVALTTEASTADLQGAGARAPVGLAGRSAATATAM